jgi:hypothetical protein
VSVWLFNQKPSIPEFTAAHLVLSNPIQLLAHENQLVHIGNYQYFTRTAFIRSFAR